MGKKAFSFSPSTFNQVPSFCTLNSIYIGAVFSPSTLEISLWWLPKGFHQDSSMLFLDSSTCLSRTLTRPDDRDLAVKHRSQRACQVRRSSEIFNRASKPLPLVLLLSFLLFLLPLLLSFLRNYSGSNLGNLLHL